METFYQCVVTGSGFIFMSKMIQMAWSGAARIDSLWRRRLLRGAACFLAICAAFGLVVVLIRGPWPIGHSLPELFVSSLIVLIAVPIITAMATSHRPPAQATNSSQT